MSSGRYVFDTNVLVSALLFGASNSGRGFRFALAHGVILASSETLRELDDVLARPKFEPYVRREERELVVAAFLERAELVEVAHTIQPCRDPRDDKFLELAVSGRATAIVTGDSDLLALNPFHGIEIVSPRTFIESLAGSP